MNNIKAVIFDLDRHFRQPPRRHSLIAAAWAETAEPEKLEPLQPDGLFYSVGAFAEWLFERVD